MTLTNTGKMRPNQNSTAFRNLVGVLTVLLLIAVGRLASATAVESPGRPSRVIVDQGKIGTIEFESIREEGIIAEGFGKKLEKTELGFPPTLGEHLQCFSKQQFDSFHYPEQKLFITLEASCFQPCRAGNIPWKCVSTVTLWKKEKEYFAKVKQIPGDFDLVEVSANHPVFLTKKLGAGDSGDEIIVYELTGKKLCPKIRRGPDFRLDDGKSTKAKFRCPSAP